MDLATLVIRLESQTAVLQKGLDQATARLKRFESDTRTSLGSIDQTFSSLGNGLKSVIATLAGGAALKSVIDATNESAAASAQLASAVQSTGAVAGFTAPQLEQMAQALADISTYDDEAVKGMQTLLLSFTNIRGPVFQQAQKAILDMSARLGIDLKTAAESVGKALQNPVDGLTSLQRAGVRLTGQQKDLIKQLVDTGDVAGAQGVVLKELEDRFSGAAEAAANTFGGALAQAKNALNDLMEQGDLPEATAALKDLTAVLKDPGVKQGVDSIFTTIITLGAKAVDIVGKTAAGLKILATGQGGNAAVDVDNRIRDLQAQLASVNQGRVPGNEPVRDKMAADLANQIAELKQRWDLVNAGIVDADGNLKEFVVTAQKLPEPVHDLGDEVKLLGARFGSMEQDASTALAKIVDQVDHLADHRFDQFGDSLTKTLEAAADTEGEAAMKSLDKFKNQYDAFWDEAARDTENVISSSLDQGFKDGARGVLDSVVDMLKKISAEIVAADLGHKLFGEDFSKTGSFAGGWLGKAAGAIAGFFGGNGDWTAGASDADWAGLAGAFGGTRDSGGMGVPGMAYAIGTGAQPEVFTPSEPGTFTPANKIGGSVSVTNHFILDQPVSRQTQLQIAQKVGASVSMATRRNG